MKPVNVLLLVLAGALGGAVVMKISQPPRRRATIAAVASKGEADKLPAPQLTDPNPAPSPQPVAPPPASAPAAVASAAPSSQPAAVAQAADESAAERTLPVTDPSVRNTMRPRHPAVTRAEAPVAARMAPPTVSRRAPVVVAQAQPPASSYPQSAAPAAAKPAVEAPPTAAAEPPEPLTVPSTPPARKDPEYTTPPSAPQPVIPTPHTVTLNAGFLIPVRLVDNLSSDRNQNGDRFVASLDHELVVDGFVIAERGARVEGQVVGVSKGTKTAGNAMLALEVTAIYTSDNQYVQVQTDAFNKRSEPDHRADAEKIGGGAAVGAIIGAIAGGGKGAAIGAGVGGGAGAGDVVLTRRAATLPSETRISFRMRAPVSITERLQ